MPTPRLANPTTAEAAPTGAPTTVENVLKLIIPDSVPTNMVPYVIPVNILHPVETELFTGTDAEVGVGVGVGVGFEFDETGTNGFVPEVGLGTGCDIDLGAGVGAGEGLGAGVGAGEGLAAASLEFAPIVAIDKTVNPIAEHLFRIFRFMWCSIQ